jgi:hypothetical protein
MKCRAFRGTLVLSAALLTVALPGGVLHGQVPDSLSNAALEQEEGAEPEELSTIRISPRGAFIRSALIPGWGHAKVGAHVRGAFYFSAEAASAYMIFKTQTRLDRTQRKLALREAAVTGRLEAEGVTDPDEIEAALAEDPEIEDLRALEETRSGQREDWIALGLFLMLIGGVDGYVSAHLADFPTAVVLEPTPGGGMQVGLSLPVRF